MDQSTKTKTKMSVKGRPRNLIRHAARLRGDVIYYGVACKYGHQDGKRYVLGGHCWHCQRIKGNEHQRKYRKTDKCIAYQKEYQAAYYLDPKNKEKLKAAKHRYYVKTRFNDDYEAYELFKEKKEEKRAERAAHQAEVDMRKSLRNARND